MEVVQTHQFFEIHSRHPHTIVIDLDRYPELGEKLFDLGIPIIFTTSEPKTFYKGVFVLPKPPSPRHLVNCIRSATKMKQTSWSSIETCGGLTLYLTTGEVEVDYLPKKVSLKDFVVLKALVDKKKISIDEVYKEHWGQLKSAKSIPSKMNILTRQVFDEDHPKFRNAVVRENQNYRLDGEILATQSQESAELWRQGFNATQTP